MPFTKDNISFKCKHRPSYLSIHQVHMSFCTVLHSASSLPVYAQCKLITLNHQTTEANTPFSCPSLLFLCLGYSLPRAFQGSTHIIIHICPNSTSRVKLSPNILRGFNSHSVLPITAQSHSTGHYLSLYLFLCLLIISTKIQVSEKHGFASTQQ